MKKAFYLLIYLEILIFTCFTHSDASPSYKYKRCSMLYIPLLLISSQQSSSFHLPNLTRLPNIFPANHLKAKKRFYHRVESPSQTEVTAKKQVKSGQIWGRCSKNIYKSDIPRVKAYTGRLPKHTRGIEFTTEIKPDRGSPPGRAQWSGSRNDVLGDHTVAKIPVHITKNTQTQ